MDELIAEGVLMDQHEVISVHHQSTRFGYPLFELGFEEHLAAVQDFLATLQNLASVGRQGGFCYPNMHETMRQGATAAKTYLCRR